VLFFSGRRGGGLFEGAFCGWEEAGQTGDKRGYGVVGRRERKSERTTTHRAEKLAGGIGQEALGTERMATGKSRGKTIWLSANTARTQIFNTRF